jgi:hypothetical protein
MTSSYAAPEAFGSKTSACAWTSGLVSRTVSFRCSTLNTCSGESRTAGSLSGPAREVLLCGAWACLVGRRENRLGARFAGSAAAAGAVGAIRAQRPAGLTSLPDLATHCRRSNIPFTLATLLPSICTLRDGAREMSRHYGLLIICFWLLAVSWPRRRPER